MSTTQKDALASIEQAIHGIAAIQKNYGDLLRTIAEGQQEILNMLTPAAKDGPTLDELLGHIIGRQAELIGYARQNVKMQAQMEQNLPGDVVRAMAAAADAAPAINGTGRGGQRS